MKKKQQQQPMLALPHESSQSRQFRRASSVEKKETRQETDPKLANWHRTCSIRPQMPRFLRLILLFNPIIGRGKRLRPADVMVDIMMPTFSLKRSKKLLERSMSSFQCVVLCGVSKAIFTAQLEDCTTHVHVPQDPSRLRRVLSRRLFSGTRDVSVVAADVVGLSVVSSARHLTSTL